MRQTFKTLLVPDAAAVLRRFPVAVLAAAMIAGEAIANTSSWLSPLGADWRFPWLVALLSSVAIGVWSEARGMRGGARLQALALTVGAAAWFGYGTEWVSTIWSVVALLIAILAAASVDGDEQRLWSFDVRAVALLIFAFVATSVVVLGLIAIKAAAEYLFDVSFGPEPNWRLIDLGYLFVLPVYWCALLPRPDQPRLAPDDLLFKATSVLGALLAIVVAALAALLHLYAVRIAVTSAMPKNQVGWIVSVALLTGLLAWLLSSGEGGVAARLRGLFRLAWFPLTVVPAALLSVAIGQRIAAYGVTSDRYAVALAGGVSLALLAAVLFRRGRPPTIHAALLVGLVFALLAAIGPQSMPNVVASSQIARLKALLDAEKLLVDGRLAGRVDPERWGDERKREIGTIVTAIDDAGGLSRLAEIAPSENITTAWGAKTAFGVDFVRGALNGIYYSIEPKPVAVENGRLVPQFTVVGCTWDRPVGSEPKLGVVMKKTFGDVTVELLPRDVAASWPGGSAVFDVSPLQALAARDRQNDRPLSVASKDGRSTLIVQQLTFQPVGDKHEVCSLTGTALLRTPEVTPPPAAR